MKGFTILKKSQGRVDPVLINKVEELVNKDFTEDAKKAAAKKQGRGQESAQESSQSRSQENGSVWFKKKTAVRWESAIKRKEAKSSMADSNSGI